MAITLGELAVEIIAAGEATAAAAIASLTGPGDAAAASITGLDAATVGLDAVLAALSAQVARTEAELAGTGAVATVSGEGLKALDAAVAGTQGALGALEGAVAATRVSLAEIAASGGAAGVGLTALVPTAEGAAFGVNALDAALARLDAALAGTAGTITAAEAALATVGTEAAESAVGLDAAGAGAARTAAGVATLAPVAAALTPELGALRAAIGATQVALGVTAPAAAEAGAALAEAGGLALEGATGITAASGAVARLDGALAVLTSAIAPTEAALAALMAAADASAASAAATADGLAGAAVGVGAFDIAATSLSTTLGPLAVAVGEARAAIAGIGESTAAASAGVHAAGAAAAEAVPPVATLAVAAKTLDAALASTAPMADVAAAGLMELAGAAGTVDAAIASLDTFIASFTADAATAAAGAEAMAAGIAASAAPLDAVAIGMSAAGQAAAVAAAGFGSVATGANIAAAAMEALDAALAATEAYFAPLIAAWAPLLGALAAFEGLKHSISDSAELEQSQARLKLAVQDTGTSWDAAGAQMSASIQHVVDTTTVGVTDATDALQRLVLFTGNATAAQENLAFAVDLSKASGKDLDTTTRALGAALEGNTMLLQRMFPAMKGNADMLGALRTETEGYAADELQHLGGQLDMVWKNLTVMMTAFGDALAQGDGFKSIVKGISDALADAAKWIGANHAAFALLGDVIMSVVEPAWEILIGTIRMVEAVLGPLKPMFLILGEAINIAFNSAIEVIGETIAVLGEMLVLIDKGLKGLALFSAAAAALDQELDGVGDAAVTMGEKIANNAVKSMDDITTKLAEIAVAKEKLDAPAAAAPTNTNNQMLAAMQSQLALGRELSADQSTQAQGLAVLLGIQGEYDRVMSSSAASSQQKANATKIEHEAIDAIITPMKEQLDVAKALIETDANRREGIALAVQVEEIATRTAAAHGATLKEVAAAMALKHDAELALLEPMAQDLALGTDLVENARTQAQGVSLLNQTIEEATAVIESHHPSLTALAAAYKTVAAAQAALMKPMEDEISLGRDLMGEEETRAMGVAQLSDAEGRLLRMIADNADNPKILAESLKDLRAAQDAVLSALSQDVSDGAILIASTATREQAIAKLTQAETDLTFIMHDKSAQTDQVAKATREYEAAAAALLIPLSQQVERAKELSESDATRTAGLDALAQAHVELVAQLATLAEGTKEYMIVERDLKEVQVATIMALEEQTKEDEKALRNGANRSEVLRRLAADEAALKKAMQDTNLTLGQRDSLEKAAQDAAEAHGDFSKAIADNIHQELLSAQMQVRMDIANFGNNTISSIESSLEAAVKAGFAGKDPFKAMGNAMLSSMGSIFSKMGTAMISSGTIMTTFEPALADALTSGPAAVAVGALLVALGATLGGIMQGDSGSSGGANYSKNAPQTTNTTYFQTGAGGEAGNVQPQPNYPPVTIIGHNDPQAQRDLGRMMQNMASRGIPMGG